MRRVESWNPLLHLDAAADRAWASAGSGERGIGGRTPAGRPPGSAWRCWLPRPRSAAAWSRAPTSTRGSCRSTCPRQQPGLATASRPALWVQVAFAVVMVREGVWATVLEDQAAAVGAGFPSRRRPPGAPPSRGGGRWPMPVWSGSCWTASAAGPRTNSTRRCRRRATSTVRGGDEEAKNVAARAPYGRSPPTRLVSARLRRSSSAGTTTPRSAFDTVPPPEASEHSGLLAGHTPHDILSTPILERDGSGVTTLAVAGLRPLGNDALLPGTGLTGGQLRTHRAKCEHHCSRRRATRVP
jgi:hypothetical protein